MAKTLEEVLKATGFTDEQITALDPKVKQGVSQFVAQGNEALEKAELAVRANRDMYDNEIAPALNKWANETAEYQAREAAYKAALNAAKQGGFEIPAILAEPAAATSAATTTVRAADGKFVANANQVPGSPDFKKLQDDIGGAFAFVADTSWKYRTLYGKELPDSPTTLIREATAQRMSPNEYAAKKYDFAGREAAAKAEEQKKHDEAIRAEAKAQADKEWSERVGSNPNIRQASESAFSSVNKAVAAGQRKDPLKLTAEERKSNTHATIQKDFAERSSTVQ